MHNFVNRVCNKCGILDTDPLDTPCENPDDPPWPSENYLNRLRGEVKAAMRGY